ncbi:MAG: hypothetical protein IKR64_06300 [Treponema sp.]|nr:hypothetical protein [Treponema sp.]
MKKISKILIVFGVLAAAFVATSCGSLNRTYDVWYKYTNTIAELPVGTEPENPADDDPNSKGMLKNAQLYVKFNETDGLTVRVITSTQQTVTCAGGYISIPDVTIVTGFEKKYGKENFGPGRWTLLIGLGSFIEEDPPTQWTDISNIANAQFDIRRLVADFLLQLLGVN